MSQPIQQMNDDRNEQERDAPKNERLEKRHALRVERLLYLSSLHLAVVNTRQNNGRRGEVNFNVSFEPSAALMKRKDYQHASVPALFLSLADICRGLETEQSFIARKYPDPARTLIERRAEYLTIKKQIGRQFTKFLVQSAFNKLLCDGIRPTATQMAKALPGGIAFQTGMPWKNSIRLRAELGEEFQAIQIDRPHLHCWLPRNHRMGRIKWPDPLWNHNEAEAAIL
jgi:hypothetical protein